MKFVFITNSGPFVDNIRLGPFLKRRPKTPGEGGRGVLPYKGLMGMCGQPGYVFRDFCLKQGIDFIIFCRNQGIDFIIFCLKQGIFSWTINSLRVCCTNVLNRVGKSAIFVLNRVRVWGAGRHLHTQGYIVILRCLISIVALYFSPSESSYLSLCLIKMHNAKIVQTNVTECMYSVFHSCFNKFSVEITMPYALSM